MTGFNIMQHNYKESLISTLKSEYKHFPQITLPEPQGSFIESMLLMNPNLSLGGSFALEICGLLNDNARTKYPEHKQHIRDVDFNSNIIISEEKLLEMCDFFHLEKSPSQYYKIENGRHSLLKKDISKGPVRDNDYNVDIFHNHTFTTLSLPYNGKSINITHPKDIIAEKQRYALDYSYTNRLKHEKDIQIVMNLPNMSHIMWKISRVCKLQNSIRNLEEITSKITDI